MGVINIAAICPQCGKDLLLEAPLNSLTPNDMAPRVRSLITPIRSIYEYHITSEQIKDFVVQKAQHYVPNVKVEVAPRYCERKRRKPSDPHRSYASMRIAFSEEAAEKKSDMGWFGKIGEAGGNVRVVESLFKLLIQKYQYNRKEVEGWMKSYKTLEDLEETLGMTEEFINNINVYSTPQRVKTSTKESWIIFSAAPENIIADMLSEIDTEAVPGKLIIQDVFPLNKNVVKFIVHLCPGDIKLSENPHVRQILLGEEKPKK